MERLASRSHLLFLFSFAFLSACGQKGVTTSSTNAAYCTHPNPASPIAGSTGSAKIFNVDPMVAANSTTLSPGSSALDSYTSSTTLTNLLGYGTLRGNYVRVVTDRCLVNGEPFYGAYSTSNAFSYSHSDERFAEGMNYHYGNLYRSELDASGALYPTSSFMMIANCLDDYADDNAYYSKGYFSGVLTDYVCMGYSTTYPTTDFSDDSHVVIHELQHGTTGNAYSTTEDFNKLYYDEAGAINEAISDFVAIMQTEESVASPFNAFDFSRWGLGQLIGESLMRGAAKCPVWTADYPTCSNFSKTSTGFSAANQRVSFAYPDGLGWPYAGPSSGANLGSVWYFDFDNNDIGSHRVYFEEIHQTAPIITGALYDAYVGMKAGGAFGNAQDARRAMLKLLMETIKVLPKASAADPSPVTMPTFADTMVSTMNGLTTLFDTAGKKSPVTTALSDRGLTSIPAVADGWASVGTGGSNANHQGVYFYESVGALNKRIEAGNRGYVWFDIVNGDADTAAAPLLKVTISGASGKVRFTTDNLGYVSSTVAYVRYSKINGSSYVAAVNDGSAAQDTGMTTGYIDGSWGLSDSTALRIEIDSTASGSFDFNVDIKTANSSDPANKVESLVFPVSF